MLGRFGFTFPDRPTQSGQLVLDIFNKINFGDYFKITESVIIIQKFFLKIQFIKSSFVK